MNFAFRKEEPETEAELELRKRGIDPKKLRRQLLTMKQGQQTPPKQS